MWSFLKKYKNAIFNVIALAAPVVAGVVSGGVLTVPVAIAAGAALAGKLAASPIDHQFTAEDAIATATQLRKALAAPGASERPTPTGRPPVPPAA